MFDVSTLGYIQKTQSIILDYEITIKNLRKTDQLFDAGALGNFSNAGFEMVKWKFSKLLLTAFILDSWPSRNVLYHHLLPSFGLFVVVSWISFLIPPDIVPGNQH